MRSSRLALLAVLAAASLPAPASAGTTRDRALPRSRPASKPVSPEHRFPSRVRFEPNLGQWDPRIRFLGRAPTCQVMLADGEAVFRLGGPAGIPGGGLRGERPGGLRPSGSGGDLRMQFVGGNAAARIRPAGLRTSVSNYFLGSDRDHWRSSVPHFDEAAYVDLWSGIDLVFRGDPARLEYDLVVAPGADLSAARLRFSGQSAVSLDAGGNLLLRMDRGEVRQEAPRLWQDTKEGRREIAGAFRILEDGTVGFEAGSYDRDLRLVVDPKVDYSTFLGAAGRDWPMDVVVDSNGSIVVAGWTDSVSFPLQTAYQGTFGGSTNDAYITKYSADRQTLLFSTYLGGSGFDDCYSLALDASDNILLCGLTSSTNFPMVSPYQSANAGGYDDMYLVELVSTGSFIVFSTYYGTANQDEAYDLAVDSSGIYLVGATNDTAFPTNSAVQNLYGGGAADAVLAKFNTSASAVTYATYYGGSGLEFALAVAVDSSGAACVTGETLSTNFPVSGAFQAAFGDSTPSPVTRDAFFLKLASSGLSVAYASYLGGTSDDFCEQIALTAQGEICLSGYTGSAAFPTANPLQGTHGGGTSDAWCAKVNAQGSGLVFSTYWGGSGVEYTRGMGIDSSGNITFCGLTSSTNFPLQYAFQSTFLGGTPVNNDGFIVRLSGTGNQVRFSSYYGGPGADDAQSMTIDGSGNAVVVGLTDSTSFPVVSAQQVTFGGGAFDTYVLRVVLAPPTAPSILVAALQGTGAIQLTWVDQASTETGFEIERRTGAGPYSTLTTVGANVQVHQDFLVVPSTTYTYRVRAVNGDGGSAYTNEATVFTNATIPPPTAPNNLQIFVVSATETSLTWNDRSTNEYLFEVQRRVIPGTFLPAASVPTNSTAWDDTVLGPDSSVLYRVRAVGVTSPSAWTTEVYALTPPSLGLTGVKASLNDSVTAAKDKAKARGVFSFLPASADGVLDPVAQGVTIHIGGEEFPAVVTINPGDPTWKVRKTKATWATPAGSSTKAKVVIDTAKRTFSVSLSKITFPGPVANPVRLSLRVGNDAGSVRATWVNKRPGAFSYKQP